MDSSERTYRGFYINLDRSERRRLALTRHLEERGAAERYTRVPALDGRTIAADYATTLDPGNLGLWLTHERILQANLDADQHLHVLEDDVVFSKNALTLFAATLKCADEMLGPWDLLFTDVHVPLTHDAFERFSVPMNEYSRSRSQALLDLASFDFACLSSFFINKKSVAKFANLISGNWQLGSPLDLFVRRSVREGLLKAFVTVPFLTSVSAEGLVSDIRGEAGRSGRVYELYRRAFFLDADLPALLAEMNGLIQGARVAPLAALFLHAEMFSLSDQWVRFWRRVMRGPFSLRPYLSHAVVRRLLFLNSL